MVSFRLTKLGMTLSFLNISKCFVFSFLWCYCLYDFCKGLCGFKVKFGCLVIGVDKLF